MGEHDHREKNWIVPTVPHGNAVLAAPATRLGFISQHFGNSMAEVILKAIFARPVGVPNKAPSTMPIAVTIIDHRPLAV
jgi:hypothetical protein